MKVLIQRLDNGYLAHKGAGWELTRDWSEAALFEYPKPGLAEQLRGIPNAYGSIFVVVPADVLKLYEMCDRCGRLVKPAKVFFDGTQFLCPECRSEGGRSDCHVDSRRSNTSPERN